MGTKGPLRPTSTKTSREKKLVLSQR